MIKSSTPHIKNDMFSVVIFYVLACNLKKRKRKREKEMGRSKRVSE